MTPRLRGGATLGASNLGSPLCRLPDHS